MHNILNVGFIFDCCILHSIPCMFTHRSSFTRCNLLSSEWLHMNSLLYFYNLLSSSWYDQGHISTTICVTREHPTFWCSILHSLYLYTLFFSSQGAIFSPQNDSSKWIFSYIFIICTHLLEHHKKGQEIYGKTCESTLNEGQCSSFQQVVFLPRGQALFEPYLNPSSIESHTTQHLWDTPKGSPKIDGKEAPCLTPKQ